MNKLFTCALSGMAALAVFFANMGAASSCSVFALYEPDIPESLKK